MPLKIAPRSFAPASGRPPEAIRALAQAAALIRTELSQRGALGIRVEIRQQADRDEVRDLVVLALPSGVTVVSLSMEDYDRMIQRLPYQVPDAREVLLAAVQLDSARSTGEPLA